VGPSLRRHACEGNVVAKKRFIVAEDEKKDTENSPCTGKMYKEEDGGEGETGRHEECVQGNRKIKQVNICS